MFRSKYFSRMHDSCVVSLFFAPVFVPLRTQNGVSPSFGDTTARTYCAGTVVTIRFRMRTKL